jgi:hypothetical protein
LNITQRNDYNEKRTIPTDSEQNFHFASGHNPARWATKVFASLWRPAAVN